MSSSSRTVYCSCVVSEFKQPYALHITNSPLREPFYHFYVGQLSPGEAFAMNILQYCFIQQRKFVPDKVFIKKLFTLTLYPISSLESGQVYSWGDGRKGQLGLDRSWLDVQRQPTLGGSVYHYYFMVDFAFLLDSLVVLFCTA